MDGDDTENDDEFGGDEWLNNRKRARTQSQDVKNKSKHHAGDSERPNQPAHKVTNRWMLKLSR
jgi:hypothetical protein